MGLFNRERHARRGLSGFSAGSRKHGKHSPSGWEHKREQGNDVPLKTVAEPGGFFATGRKPRGAR